MRNELTLDELIERKESDVAYWTRRHAKKPNKYASEQLRIAKQYLRDYKWQRENQKAKNNETGKF